AVLSHVRFTGCHCPIHINSGEGSFMVTDSIFDDAAVAMMIGNAEGTFTRNHFLGKLSLNDLGPINANVADNYYGGGAPTISPNKPDRFKGAGTYRADPIAGVGPR
ncbi:MAG: hypothetical protein KC416_15905, partial [Myxococcales bacterium]|nr:hypothetical protein [Myxococcales bacterium]